MAFEGIRVTGAIIGMAFSKEADAESKALYDVILKADELESSLKGAALDAYHAYMVFVAQENILGGKPQGTDSGTRGQLIADMLNAFQTESGVPQPLPELSEYAAATAAISNAKLAGKIEGILHLGKINDLLIASKDVLLANGVTEEEFNELIEEYEKIYE